MYHLLILILPFSIFISAHQALAGYSNKNVEYYGYYSVPVETKYKNVATWRLKSLKWVFNKNSVRASYYLPYELVGKKHTHIVMTGKIKEGAPFFTMEGTNADAVCRASKADGYICLLHFKKLNVTKTIVDSFLKQEYKNLEQTENRILVAQLFRSDPIGIVTIYRK